MSIVAPKLDMLPSRFHHRQVGQRRRYSRIRSPLSCRRLADPQGCHWSRARKKSTQPCAPRAPPSPAGATRSPTNGARSCCALPSSSARMASDLSASSMPRTAASTTSLMVCGVGCRPVRIQCRLYRQDRGRSRADLAAAGLRLYARRAVWRDRHPGAVEWPRHLVRPDDRACHGGRQHLHHQADRVRATPACSSANWRSRQAFPKASSTSSPAMSRRARR